MEPNDNLWWRDGVIYQIYSRSFSDSNGDGIGDLTGIIQKLGYLVNLGVEAIWLSPINPSPDVDFGYDVSDYRSVDPRFGSLENLETLLEACHKRGLKLILDLVLNHTSDQHPWFKASRSSRDNSRRDWYIWRDPAIGGNPPNNWESVFGGKAWEFDKSTGQYYLHMFYREQPDLNWRNPEVKNEMLDTLKFWLDFGIDGFRLDVCNLYFKHLDLPNNPTKFGLRSFDRLIHIYDTDQPELIPLLREIRSLLDQYDNRFAVGETFLDSPEKAAKYCGKGLLHETFNFDLIHSPWKPARFQKAIQEAEFHLPAEAWPSLVMNNHDNPRSSSRFGRGENDLRLKAAAAFFLTQRGTPFLYYGEEIGMRDLSLPRSKIQDPVGRKYWPLFKGRDGCRGPMQWDVSQYGGFSTYKPWLSINPDYLERNAAVQSSSSDSLFHYYRKLIQLRKEIPAIRDGMLMPLTYEPRRVLAYLRKNGHQTVLVAINFSRRRFNLVLGSSLARLPWKLLLSSQPREQVEIRDSLLQLQPEEACILIQT